MKQAAMTGLAVLALVASPPSARGDETSNAVAASMAGGAIAGMMCWALASGDEDDDAARYDRRGLMVGLSGVSAFETFSNEAHSDFRDRLGVRGQVVGLSVDDGFGLNGRVGYRCHPRFSTELEVEWVNGFDTGLSLPGLGQVATVDVAPVVITVNGKGHLLTGRYQPFVLFGAGLMTVETKVHDTLGLGILGSGREEAFVTRFGLGIDVYATEQLVASLDVNYLIPFDKLDYLDYVSINWGIQYRF